MKTVQETVKEVLAKLEQAKPWSEAHFRAVSFKGLSSEVRSKSHGTMPIDGESYSIYLYEVGLANLSVFTASTTEAQALAFRLFEKCFVFETAAICSPTELARVLNTLYRSPHWQAIAERFEKANK